jgi:hypothetical protein
MVDDRTSLESSPAFLSLSVSVGGRNVNLNLVQVVDLEDDVPVYFLVNRGGSFIAQRAPTATESVMLNA